MLLRHYAIRQRAAAAFDCQDRSALIVARVCAAASAARHTRDYVATAARYSDATPARYAFVMHVARAARELCSLFLLYDIETRSEYMARRLLLARQLVDAMPLPSPRDADRSRRSMMSICALCRKILCAYEICASACALRGACRVIMRDALTMPRKRRKAARRCECYMRSRRYSATAQRGRCPR